jgi:uncharacterized protein
MSWTLTEADISRITLGAGVLGTGGGGNPWLGALMAKAQLAEGRVIRVIGLDELAPDAHVMALAGIGAPTVGVERMVEGSESARLIRVMEGHLGYRIDALIADEIGGSNAIAPMIAAARLGIPVVDGDGMGRALPEVQMTTFFVNGHVAHPAGLIDFEGNTLIVTEARSPEMLERLLRAGTVAMGSAAYFTTAPMTGAFVRAHAVPGTLRLAWAIGDAVLEARATKADPVAAICGVMGAKVLLCGKVTDVGRETRGGFLRGLVTLAGLDADRGRTVTITVQNEYLAAWEGGAALALTPDLICIVDSETGRSIGSEEIRYGMRVSVMSSPAHPHMTTAAALQRVGPQAFGLAAM